MSRRDRVLPYLATVATWAVATGAMLPLRSSLRLATVALVYLLSVFFSGVWWGRTPSMVASLLSFLSLNYFFTTPYGTLRVAETQDVISLVVFLVVAETTARLVTRLRESEAEAQRRAWEASTLYALTHDLTTATDAPEILEDVASLVVKRIGVARCSVYLTDDKSRLYLVSHSPAPRPVENAPPPEGAQRALSAGARYDSDNASDYPIAVAGRVSGVLHVEAAAGSPGFPEAVQRVLATFASHAAILIEQLRLRHEASQAEVLRKADELKSSLLSAVSHDLRTPLSSIRIAATGLLRDDFRADEATRREFLRMIDTEAARLARLVTNLLDLSRIEAGVLRPDKVPCELQEVVARAVDDLQERLRSHRLVIDVPPDLPLVPLDLTEIEDVLVNLLDNSARHSPEGSVVRIMAQRRGDEVVVQVENEGPPIPVNAAKEIFDRFYGGQHDQRSVGLGLAICKGLVEAHGGCIWVERPGEPGARFAFSLPLEGSTSLVAAELGGS